MPQGRGYLDGSCVTWPSVNSALPLQPSFSHLGLYVKSLPVMERFVLRRSWVLRHGSPGEC